MDKWQKIEIIINKLLESIKSMVQGIYNKVAPDRFISFIKKSSEKVSSRKQKLSSKTSGFLGKFMSVLQTIKGKFAVVLKRFKDILITLVSKFKDTNFKEMGIKNILLLLLAIITPFALRAKTWYLALKPTTIMGFVVVSSIGSLTGINIYTQSQKIAEKAAAREPAAKVDKATAISTRPGYYKSFEKELVIRNVKFPVHFDSKNSMRTLSMDFTLVTSNRYIKEFFNDNKKIILIKDRLNTMIRPIVPQFPLEDEGKQVIKDKIRVELNKLIKELKIDGHIKTVHIHSILAG